MFCFHDIEDIFIITIVASPEYNIIYDTMFLICLSFGNY